MTDKIYLDYNASTPIAPEVQAAMKPFLTGNYGNPSAGHWAAAPVEEAYEKARARVASLLGCAETELIFTSGGSESNNQVLKGVFHALREKGGHVVTTEVEHPSVKNSCNFLASLGATVSYVGVDSRGLVEPADVEAAVTDETILISVMHANNEVGTIQPLAEISKIGRRNDVLTHTDAAQSVGKIPVKVDELGVDLLTVAGHKFYAPKGIGALYVREGTEIEPLIHGGGQEKGLRAGTENTLLAAGLGKAAELAETDPQGPQVVQLRDYFWQRLKDSFGDAVRLNGHPELRLPNTLNVSFPGETGEAILNSLPDLAASTGSACHSGKASYSSVLSAMGLSEERMRGTIRFSLGRFNDRDELDRVVGQLEELLETG